MFNKREKAVEIRMYVPEEASTGNYAVIQLSEFTYKLANNDPFSETLSYGTIIEVESKVKEEDDEKVYTLKKVLKESDFSINVIFLPSELNETELRIVGKMIIDEGGFWEVNFGGMGYVNLPKQSKLDIIEELNKLIKEKKNNQ
jgi:hypothetical protein